MPTSPTTGRFARGRVERGPVDVVLMGVVFALVAIGLVTVYNGSALAAWDATGGTNDMAHFRDQAIGALIGVGALVVGMRVDYRLWQRMAYPILGVALFLLILTALPGISVTVKGATRWIDLGVVRFQPSEFVKIAIAIYLAFSVTKKNDKMHYFVESFVAHGLVLSVFIALLMKQPDLGSSIILSTMTGIILFTSGAKISYIFGFITTGALLLFAAIQSASYRMDRMTAWFNPWSDIGDKGYQLANSYTALASGGVSGTGLGEGSGRLGYVPELYNDFVAALIGEEFGFIGIVAIIALYGLFMWRGVIIAKGARDRFGTWLAFGITMLISLQALVNIGVVTGTLPTKGLTLPFVSLGRSSLVMLMFAAGILLNISQRNPDITGDRRRSESSRLDRLTLAGKVRRARDRRISRQLDAAGRDV